MERSAIEAPMQSRISSPELLLLSANTEWSLGEQIQLHSDWVHRHPTSTSDLVYTRGLHKEHLSHRAFSLLQDGDIIEIAPGGKSPAEAPQITMVFSGQGAQWPEMAKQLILCDPSFRNDMLQMGQKLKDIAHPLQEDLHGK